MAASTHRTVVESKQFERELKGIESNPIAAEDLVEGAKWMLCRDPYRGVQLAPRSRVWFLAIDPPKAKPVGLYYAFGPDEVHFLSVTQG
jgi:hypothetical protein